MTIEFLHPTRPAVLQVLDVDAEPAGQVAQRAVRGIAGPVLEPRDVGKGHAGASEVALREPAREPQPPNPLPDGFL
jgi:hypothetical protein